MARDLLTLVCLTLWFYVALDAWRLHLERRRIASAEDEDSRLEEQKLWRALREE